METVTVSKEDLLKALKENQLKHEKEHDEAYEAWRTAKVAELCEWHKKLLSGVDIPASSTLAKPTSYDKEYNRAIKMVSMSVDATIELSEHDFSRYVLDEWEWVNQFKNVTSFYKSAQFNK